MLQPLAHAKDYLSNRSSEGNIMTHLEGKIDRVWSLMQQIEVAMVVTHDGHGDQLRGRPMAAHPVPQENAIFFLTDAEAAKDDEVNRNNNVCLAFADIKAQKYVSVTGLANLSDDRDTIRQLWSNTDKAYWKDENDPSIRLLRVVPTFAEYWDSPGVVVSYVKMVGAALTGGKPERRDNEKVELSASVRS
jgi:general stress protein 26